MTKQATTTTKKATPPVNTRKVPAPIIRKLGTASKKAHDAIAKYPSTAAIERDALAGLKAVRAIVAKTQAGPRSRFGHMMNCQNGVVDEAILNCTDFNFGAWLKDVAKAECKSRRTKPEDTAGMARRIRDHVLNLGGMTTIGLRNMPKRLKYVNLDHRADEIMELILPTCLLFDIWVKEAKF